MGMKPINNSIVCPLSNQKQSVIIRTWSDWRASDWWTMLLILSCYSPLPLSATLVFTILT